MRRPREAEPEGGARRASPSPRVLVAVLAYNLPETTAATLRSLRQQTRPDFRLLLLDNASDESSTERAAREFEGLEVRRLPENRGYTGGVNFALDLARAEKLRLSALRHPRR